MTWGHGVLWWGEWGIQAKGHGLKRQCVAFQCLKVIKSSFITGNRNPYRKKKKLLLGTSSNDLNIELYHSTPGI